MKKKFILILLFLLLLTSFACAPRYRSETKDIDNGQAKMIAHRGLSGIEVENTASAFISAGKRTYYGIEADVRKTGDGKYIICHDADLKNLAGKDIVVDKTPLSDLLNLSIYDKNGKTDPGERLIELSSYIEICKEYQKVAVLELKYDFNKQEVSEIIDIINEYDYINQVVFISFDYDNLLYVRELLPNQPVQYVFSKFTNEILEKVIDQKMDVCVKYTAFSKKKLDKLHDAGLKMCCWTVDSKLVAKWLIFRGVDFITTNILE